VDAGRFLAPFAEYEGTVRPEWVDYNGHMNLAYYVVLFDEAVELLFAAIGYGAGYRATTNHGPFALETHTLYEREVLAGERVRVSSQLVAIDTKRIHVAHEMTRVADGVRAACQEVMYLNVDLARRKSARFATDLDARLAAAAEAHATLPRPDWVGRRVAMRGPN
jgi:acyl-CoA thioester hydrolase